MDIHDLFEARRNPEINTGNRWKNFTEHFAPYFGREDAFVSMINVPKIGINPMSGHDGTPTAIYCYPLSVPEIINQFTSTTAGSKLPYMSHARYAALIIEKQGLRKLSSEMSEGEAEASIDRLDDIMERIIDPLIWGQLKTYAAHIRRCETHYGHLFEYTRAAAQVLVTRAKYGDDLDLLDSWSVGDFAQAMVSADDSRPRAWNSLLRRLGYDAIADYGTRFIYSLEPYQTGFLHSGCIANYEICRNGTSGVYGHSDGKQVELQSFNQFAKLVHSGEINTRDALSMMKAMVNKNDAGVHDNTVYGTYNPNIRPSRSQIETTMAYLKQHDPDGFARYANAYR